MEEIGYRTAVFSLDSIGGCQGEYIEWRLLSCTLEGTPLGELVAAEAIDLLKGAVENSPANRAAPVLGV